MASCSALGVDIISDSSFSSSETDSDSWAEVVRLHGNEHNLPAYLVSPEWMFSM